MSTITKNAYGKLNLTLDVLGKRSDGYHEMQMLMQSVSLCDEVTVTLKEEAGFSCACDLMDVPTGDGNLAVKAARVFCDAFSVDGGVDVCIRKKIPMQAGMAGGSADAAAVLHGLNELCGMPFDVKTLMALGAKVGSDVPYCVLGGTALAEGRGEILTPLRKIPQCSFVLVKPEFSVSTPVLFSELDCAEVFEHPDTEGALQAVECGDLQGICSCLYNVFQPVLTARFPVIDTICNHLRGDGALGACLTGTGSVVYGVFDDTALANKSADKLAKAGFFVFMAKPV